MQWLKDLISALVGALVAFYTGKISQQLKDSERELGRMEKAMRAASVNSSRPVDERLRDAKQRGLYRVSGEPSDNK